MILTNLIRTLRGKEPLVKATIFFKSGHKFTGLFEKLEWRCDGDRFTNIKWTMPRRGNKEVLNTLKLDDIAAIITHT